jgi:hypothetical protein
MTKAWNRARSATGWQALWQLNVTGQYGLVCYVLVCYIVVKTKHMDFFDL